MSDSDWTQKLRDMGLLPIQSVFGNKLLDPQSARVHLLSAPPGAGATHTTIATIAYGLESGLVDRVLVIAPRALGFEAMSRLHDAAAGVSAWSVDKDSLIQFEAKTAGESDIWPPRGAFVTSLDFAKQSRVSKYFTGCRWDLVVFDEAHLLTPNSARGELLQQILAGPAKRIVLLDRVGKFHDADSLLSIATDISADVTTWRFHDLKTWEGKELEQSQLEWQIVQYDMHESEAAFYEALANTAKQIDAAIRANSLFFQTLMNRATSCLYSVERALMDQRGRIVHRRNELVHGIDRRYDQLSLFDDEDDTALQPATHEDRSQQLERYENTVRQIDDTLAQLDELETDSKSEELLRVLRSLGEANVCVLSQYESTVTHLESRLGDEPSLQPIVLSGRVASDELQSRLMRIRMGPALTIATDAILKGIELPADVVIHYDLPSKPAYLYVRVARLSGIGRSGVVRMIGLVERNAVTGQLWNKLLTRAQAIEIDDWQQDTEYPEIDGDATL